MNRTRKSSQSERRLDKVIEDVIQSEIGKIDELPPEVKARVREVTGEFISAYVEMIRLRDKHPKEWQPKKISIAPEMVEDMLHFFSDYRQLARDFKLIHQKAKKLLRLDREKDPRGFEDLARDIVSDRKHAADMSRLFDL